jgi:hypothetical protein
MQLQNLVDESIRELKKWRPSDVCLQAAQKEDFGETAKLIERTFIRESRYFNRMWTLQEGVAGLVASIECGSIQIDLGRLVKTVYCLSTIQSCRNRRLRR